MAKPSGGGLKLDLDRFRRDADELIRVMKKGARWLHRASQGFDSSARIGRGGGLSQLGNAATTSGVVSGFLGGPATPPS